MRRLWEASRSSLAYVLMAVKSEVMITIAQIAHVKHGSAHTSSSRPTGKGSIVSWRVRCGGRRGGIFC